VLPRQQTLRAALDWSWALLGEPERVLLRRLSVFAGGWQVEAAEAVCPGGAIVGWTVPALLGGLVSKSLVGLEESAAEARYRLLETVRQYAAERLAAAGEEEEAREQHLAHFLALAEAAAPRLTGPEQGTWLARLEREHDNLRAALGWARAQGDGERGLRLAAALCWFWYMRGYLNEGRGWLEEALARAATAPAALRATALNGAGNLASDQGEYGQAEVLYAQALALRRELGDKRGIAGSLSNLAGVAERRGDYGRAVPLFEEALALARVSGDTLSIAKTLGNLGLALGHQGNIEREAALFEEALALFRALGDRHSIAGALDNLGLVAFQQGEYERARALHDEALSLFRALEAKRGIAGSLTNLGAVAERQGDYEQATDLSRESLLLNRAIGAEEQAVEGLQTMVLVAAARGQPKRAAQLAGAAEALREALEVPMRSHQQTIYAQAVRAMRAALGEEAFAAAWAEGRAHSLAHAIDLALAADPAGDGKRLQGGMQLPP
jgi:tetratricopeptide (TPR) repeat protein